MKEYYRCMSKEEADADLKRRYDFKESPGGNAGAFLCFIVGILMIGFVGLFIYVVVASIFGFL
jgi:hypothetical protein